MTQQHTQHREARKKRYSIARQNNSIELIRQDADSQLQRTSKAHGHYLTAYLRQDCILSCPISSRLRPGGEICDSGCTGQSLSQFDAGDCWKSSLLLRYADLESA